MKLRDLFSRREPDGESAGRPASPAERFLSRIHDEVARGPLNLPCFPDVVPRVRTALDDPKGTAEDIVKIAGTEPRLVARLLQTANSVVFNPGGKPAPHLRSAVTRLGGNLVQSVVMVFAVQQMKADPSLRPVVDPLTKLWEKSITVASFCQSLAQQIRVPQDKVFMTGLLHGIGHFYLLVRAAEPQSGVSVDELTPELVAEWHPRLGKAVLMKWGFEPVVCEAIANQNDHVREHALAADITDVVIASVVLAGSLLELDGDLSRTEDVTAFRRLGLSDEELRAVLEHTEYSLDSLRAALA